MLGLRLSVLSRVLREQVARGPGMCVRCRRLLDRGSTQRWSSSAKPKNEITISDRGRTELLEVLEIRAQQLQVDKGSPMLKTGNKKQTARKEEKEQTKQNLKAVHSSKRQMEKLKNEKCKQKNENILQTKTLPVRTEQCQPQKDINVKKVQKKTAPQPKDDDHSLKSVKPTAMAVRDLDLDEVSCEDSRLTGNGREVSEDKDGNRFGDIQQNMHCYLETCIFLGDMNKAQQCLNYYLQHPVRKTQLNVAMFNLLLKEWAKKASLPEIGHTFTLMDKAGLKPNLGSYAAAFEAFGRIEGNAINIKSCLRQMEKDGLSVDLLFQGLTYRDDERQMVLKAIRQVRPAFTPPPRIEVVLDSPLVKNFYKHSPPCYPKMDFTVTDLQERFEEQLKIESCDTVTINSVEAIKPVTDKKMKARAVLASLRSVWGKTLLHSLQDSKSQLAEISKRTRRINIYPYLCLLEDEQYVEIMLQALTRLQPTGESFLTISRDLGTKIYNMFFIRRQLQGDHVDRIRLLYKEYCKLLSKEGKISGLLPRELWEKVEHEAFGGPCDSRSHSPWPRSLLVQLGTHLVDLMVKTIKITNNLLSPRSDPKLIPVLYHMYSFRSTHQIGLIKPHPIYSQILLDAEETLLTFDAAVMPTKCPPLPWTSLQCGPYLLSPAQLMRCSEGVVQHQLLLEKCAQGQLFPVLDSVNQLGECAWRINQPILDIIVSIFNDKGNEKLDIPPPLSEAPVSSVQLPGMLSSWEKFVHQKELARCRKKTTEMYSLRMDALYKLSIANHLRDQIFWFPHNMDFRGRTYPCPPYFNHLGSDVTRSLLVFAEGHPLGPNGLNWLKIHLINLTGFKKKFSLQQRKEYADEIIQDILDSADHPLTGRKWWMKSDEPWQTLACCMEIAKAVRSSDPAKYISHFPVHQDGSCNGLQHYAALGRDKIGAKSVNLMPCDTPQDVYSEVAQQVEEFRKRDAKKEIKIAQVLEGFIGRKVVKQTVMTVVYGVTRYGGRLQIEKRLRETHSFPQEYVWQASQYLVQQVFSSLKEMFSGTREIQNWLTESARRISKSGATVQWVTPLGLPIIQPYHRKKSVAFKSNLQKLHVTNRSDADEKPDTMKQKNAFPPNFIHSLDSAHMMLTALHCYARGLTFVSVHDCFWTHADTVDIMNKVCREQFVSLHSQPILEDLSKFLIQKYCSSSQCMSPDNLKMKAHFSSLPLTGTFELQNVKDSTYFFS
ncbi:DNA-directed RNA polymerase, mitochondrial [Rana temporaria]|uniref:DNA-directed RNA polymerase, mitochondrial n=1 Tax=Rana temporaria TaxID=8407 RepID=UPI001AACB888|nr:DNA-directed RNA polymerase, mitochondrial [Rana temporaria]